ncbi:DapH/DapD/GlmU-related protein [Tepidamorphus sp. 3E244]|uniref:DapH/DapD/GlmU-related protein n=1 Tax=Tepidamorphus sp. 3E244 TaxID=3385498 RepID=UPI0038FCED3B
MIEEELSLSRDEALAAGVLILAPGARVSPSIRVVPREDDGTDHGPVEIGEDTIVREGVVLSTGTRLGRNVMVGHNCVIRRCFTIGDNSMLSHLVSVQHDVTVGSLSRISSLTHLAGGTLIEDRVQIGANVATVDSNAMRWPEKDKQKTLLRGPIFRRGCRVGSGTTILSGVEIGRNTMIGAGSTVTRDMPEGVVAYGNPAYVQRDRHDIPDHLK